MTFVEKEECFAEPKKNNSVDYAKRKHVTCYHRIYHRYEGSSEFNGTKNIEIEENYLGKTNIHPAKNIKKNQLPGAAKINNVRSS